jgi:hypothetical protein
MKEWREKVISELIQRGGGPKNMSEQMLNHLSFHLSIQLRIGLNDAQAMIRSRINPSLTYGLEDYRASLTNRLNSLYADEHKRQAALSAELFSEYLGLTVEDYKAKVPVFLNRPNVYGSQSAKPLMSEGSRISWEEQVRLSKIVPDPSIQVNISPFEPKEPFTSWVTLPSTPYGLMSESMSKMLGRRVATFAESVAFVNMYPQVLAKAGGGLSLVGLRDGRNIPTLDCRQPTITLQNYTQDDFMTPRFPVLIALTPLNSARI